MKSLQNHYKIPSQVEPMARPEPPNSCAGEHPCWPPPRQWHLCWPVGDFMGKGEATNIIGWWFGPFFIFPYIGNNHPNWLMFFREVKKTPTRMFLHFFLTIKEAGPRSATHQRDPGTSGAPAPGLCPKKIVSQHQRWSGMNSFLSTRWRTFMFNTQIWGKALRS